MYGHRARIGYTSPMMLTEVFPYEFYRMAPPGVTLVLTTLAILDLTGDEVKRSADVSRPAAREMARAGIDLVVLGGGPINRAAGGALGVEHLVREMEEACGIPIATSMTAQMHALQAVGAKRVAAVQPFEDAAVSTYNYLSDYGFEGVGIKDAGYPAIDLGRIPLEVAVRLGREVIREHPSADTLYFPCPHWAVVEAVEVLEQELGVAVVTSGQAIFWEAARRCNIADPIPGYGRLLREH